MGLQIDCRHILEIYFVVCSMNELKVIKPSSVKLEPIVVGLGNVSNENVNDVSTLEVDTTNTFQQTKITGILAPLVAVNGYVLDWNDIISFELESTGVVPSCKAVLRDRKGLFHNLVSIDQNNTLRVQIIPPFDKTYNKIDLQFLIINFTITPNTNNQFEIEAVYNNSKLLTARFEMLGLISTIDLCKKLIEDTGLGFISNIDKTEDARYIGLQYENYKDLLVREIENSLSNESCVLDCWIDVWNNLTLCNIFSRLKTKDKLEAEKYHLTVLQDWISYINSDVTVEPKQTEPLFTNHTVAENTDLHIENYYIENKPITSSTGNEFILSVYEENKKDCLDHLLGNKTQNNLFPKYEYLGEVYGNYNYLLAKKQREFFLRQIQTQSLWICTKVPQLGIYRGSQIRVVWYDNNSQYSDDKNNFQSAGMEIPEIKDTWLKEWSQLSKSGESLCLNMQVTGQYLVVGIIYRYTIDRGWQCWYRLCKIE